MKLQDRLRSREDLSYAFSVLVVLVSVALAGWLRDVTVFFSGALAAFTVLLWNVNRSTLELQKRFDQREEGRATPAPVFHDTSALKEGSAFNVEKTAGELFFVFSISNPGDISILVDAVQIKDEDMGSPSASRVSWIVRYPVLAPSPRGGPYSHDFPIPVFPRGLTEVNAVLTLHDKGIHDAGRDRNSFTYTVRYRIGNSTESNEASRALGNTDNPAA